MKSTAEIKVRRQTWVVSLASITVLALAVSTNAQTQARSAASKYADAVAKAPDAPVRAATNDPSYTIGPQDMLDVNVWKEPDVSRTVQVRPDGKISLPLLDDIQAAGLTPKQLTDSVTEGLRKYIENPEVTVIVTQINSLRVYLIGQVTRPGAYPLLPGMTILQAISSGGGLAQFANRKKIYLMRTENGTPTKYPFNYKDVIEGRKPEQNLPLKPGDTIVVP
jgi:polysaccharide biosynthesis/export protein